MIVLAASLAALFTFGVAVARATAARDESRATRATRGALAALAALIAIEALLGALGLLTSGATLLGLALAAAAAASFARGRRLPAAAAPREAWTAPEAGLAAALVLALALRLFAGLDKTTFLYDTLSYHLHVPVTWLQARRLEIVPAVFGDPSPAYAPANLELVYLFLMAPVASARLASVGQLPFAALAALAIVAAVREAGGGRAGGLGAALAFLLVPEIWQQAPTAMTDLGMAALLLASLPFALRLRRTGAAAELLACAAALGLGAGTKYAGAVLGLPFAALAVAAVVRCKPDPRALLAALALALACGGFWYLRNLALTGNPIYPVATAGLPGLYDARAMRAWDYHLPVGGLAALGEMLLASGVGFASAGLLALARARRGFEAPLALALVALFWLAIPYQESRFLFAAFGVAAVALGRLASRPPAALGWSALAAALAGALVEWPTPARWALIPAAVIGALGHAAGRRLPPRLAARLLRVGAPMLAAALAAALTIRLQGLRARDPGYSVGDDDLALAWTWFRAQVHDARVAYTGTNLAFPLAGEGLSNRVFYVNVAGPAGARLHDFQPTRSDRAGSAEPAPYREGARFDTWLANLRDARAQVLFVAALYPIVRRNIAADDEGFPVERAWADGHPTLFRLRYAAPAARVYTIVPP